MLNKRISNEVVFRIKDDKENNPSIIFADYIVDGFPQRGATFPINDIGVIGLLVSIESEILEDKEVIKLKEQDNVK